MDLTLVVVAFLLFAVLLSVGIVLAVALPQMRGRADGAAAEASVEDRHTSRTGR